MNHQAAAATTIAFPSHAAAGFVLIAEDGMRHTLIEHTHNAQLRLAKFTHERVAIHRWRCVYSDNAARIVAALHNRFADKRLTGTDYFVIDYALAYHDLLEFDCEQSDIKGSGDLVVGTLCRISGDNVPRPKLFEVSAFRYSGTTRMARIKPCLPDKDSPVAQIAHDVPANLLIRVPARETA